MRTFVFGTKEDGECVSTAIAEFASADTVSAAAEKKHQLKGLPRRALDLLHDAIARAADTSIPPSEYVPKGVKGVKMDVWRERCRQARLADSDSIKAQSAAFRRCYEKLTSFGLVRAHEDWVWPTKRQPDDQIDDDVDGDDE
jgi:hypothetical protein